MQTVFQRAVLSTWGEKSCGPGKYQARYEQWDCNACEPGYFAAEEGRSMCAACPRGYRGIRNGTDLNKIRIARNQSLMSATCLSPECSAPLHEFCAACPSGQYTSTQGATACESCEPGLYVAGTGSGSCEMCPAGYITDKHQQTQCAGCNVGTHQADVRQTRCKTCTRGRFTDMTGTVSCDACDTCKAGYSVNLSQTCTASSGGIAPPSLNSSDAAVPKYCKTCGQGTYGDATNLGACKLCPAGYISTTNISFSCEMCVPGKNAARNGSWVCKTCEANSAQPAPGKSECKACGQGEVSDPGATECAYCPEGFRTSTSGCLRCEAGTFAPSIKETECKSCSPGQYSNELAQTGCIRCPAGQAQAMRNSTACVSCQPGLHTSAPGRSECVQCTAKEEYASALGASECQRCADHAEVFYRLGHKLHLQTCQCADGFYQPLLGLDSILVPNATGVAVKACRKCPEGSTCHGCDRASSGISCDFAFEGRLATRAGFWRDRDIRTMQTITGREGDTEVFLPCVIEEACEGTVDILKRLAAKAQARLHENATTTANRTGAINGTIDRWGQCREGHTQIMCAQCAASWSPGASGICEKCDASSNAQSSKLSAKLGLLFGVSFVVWAGLVAVLLSSAGNHTDVARTHDAREAAADGDGALSNAARLSETLQRLGTVTPMLQRIVALDDVFATIDWPPIMTEILRVMKILVMQVGTMLAFIAPCHLYVDVEGEMLIAVLTLPWALLIGLAAKYGARKIMVWQRWRNNREKRRAERKAAQFQRRRQRMLGTQGPASQTEEGLTGTSNTAAASDSHVPAEATHTMRQRSASVRLLAIGMLGAKLAHPGISAQLLTIGVCQTVGEGSSEYVLRASVDIQCDLNDDKYAELVTIATVGIIFVTAGLPLALAVMIYRDHIRAVAEATTHELEEAQDRRHDALGIWHVPTPQERLASRVHQWTARRKARLETMRHRSINWIVEKWKPHLWWWFVVEMLFSLILISILQLAAEVLWFQYYTALFTAALQAMLPALVRPHVSRSDDTVAIIGGTVYFALVLGRMPGILVDLQEHSSDSARADAKYDAELLLDTTFLIGLTAMIVAVGQAALRRAWLRTRWSRDKMNMLTSILCSPLCRCCGKAQRTSNRGTGRSPVHPRHRSGVVVPLRAVRAGSGSSSDGRNINEAAAKERGTGDAAGGSPSLQQSHLVSSSSRVNRHTQKGTVRYLAPHGGVLATRSDAKHQTFDILRRCREELLASVAPRLRRRYETAWEQLEKLQCEIMATAIQAAARGRQSRINVVRVLAEVGRASRPTLTDGKKCGQGTGETQFGIGKSVRTDAFTRALSKSSTPSIRRAPSLHRQLKHSRTETAVLLAAAAAYADDSNEAEDDHDMDTEGDVQRNIGREERQARRDGSATALLHAAETFTSAEISGLHEKRLSDAQVVAILRVQHEREHADYRAALATEAEEAKAAGKRRTLRKGFLHHFRRSSLGDADLATVFASVDRDGSGVIDVSELIEVYKTMFHRSLSEDDARELMRAADEDGDSNTMTLPELRSLLVSGKK